MLLHHLLVCAVILVVVGPFFSLTMQWFSQCLLSVVTPSIILHHFIQVSSSDHLDNNIYSTYTTETTNNRNSSSNNNNTFNVSQLVDSSLPLLHPTEYITFPLEHLILLTACYFINKCFYVTNSNLWQCVSAIVTSMFNLLMTILLSCVIFFISGADIWSRSVHTHI
jgi:hypothetical protein